MCCRFFLGGGLADLILWKKNMSASWWCLATSYAIVFGNIPNFAQACESNWKLDRVFLYLCPCARARVCFSGVWDLAITKPDLLGSDLLFFTSPTYQPPASVAVKRNGWYFRGELLFPFLAPVFFFILTCCDRARIHHRWAGAWQTSFERLPHFVPAMFF